MVKASRARYRNLSVLLLRHNNTSSIAQLILRLIGNAPHLTMLWKGLNSNPPCSVGLAIQEEAMDVARPNPLGTHNHADVVNILHQLNIMKGARLFTGRSNKGFFSTTQILVQRFGHLRRESDAQHRNRNIK